MFEIQCSDIISAIEILEREDFTESVTVFGNAIHLSMRADIKTLKVKEEAIRIISSALKENDQLKVYNIHEINPSLEDVFLYLMENIETNA